MEEHVLVAWMLYTKKRFAEAARFYAAAFEQRPKLWGSLNYSAVRCAVLADTPAWRGRALVWLCANLTQFGPEPAQGRPSLEIWKRDPALARVRDRIGGLPAAERTAWTRFWADVDALLARAVAK